MPHPSKSVISIAAIALVFSIPASSQDERTGSTPPANPKPFQDVGPAKNNNGTGFLERKFNLSKAEADRRLDLQSEAEAFSSSLAKQYPDAFLGLEIQHQPYRIILRVGFEIHENRANLRIMIMAAAA